jgi:signal transduction histidine kinase
MTFRTRLLVALTFVVAAPLVLLGVMIPREMTERFTAEYRARARALAAGITRSIVEEGARIDSRLGVVAADVRDDNRIRLAVAGDPTMRAELLDFGERAVLQTGLSALQIQNDSGRILTSGHFRNDFDRVDPRLPTALRGATDQTAIVSLRTPRGRMLVLARMDSLRVGRRSLTIIGGVAVGDDFLGALTPASELRVRVALPDGAPVTTGGNVPGQQEPVEPGVPIDSISLPYIDASGDSIAVGSARFVISAATTQLDLLLRDVRVWIVGTVLVATAAAFAVALWLAARLSRPIADLAAETGRVDLDRTDGRFANADRDDEIGVLARGLNSMLARLRSAAGQLRDAEHRATVGEVARQVNHDIKNGLTPIRNVVRHLAEVAREAPADLPKVFVDRQTTLESSVEYLDTLARNYARLSPRLDVAPCDVAPVIEEVIRGAATRGATVRSTVVPGIPPVVADAAVLRRILENLVGNAIDALDGKPGEVAVTAASAAGDGSSDMVVLTVSDTGRGMTERELAKAFDDFYTTKEGGTGLGLSVVRRLVADLSGALRVDTEPGRGTRVTVRIPAATPRAAGSARPPAAAGRGAR